MKCSRVALLLALVLASRTVGVLAADNGTVPAGERAVLLPLPWLEPLRQAVLFQSDACSRDDESAGNASSPYDKYYAAGPDWGCCEASFQDENAQLVSDNDAKRAEAEEELGIDAGLASGLQRGASWFAASGKAAMNYASQCWRQAAAFLCGRGLNGEEIGLESDDGSDDLAEAADEPSTVETKRVAEGKPARPTPIECLYVGSSPTYEGASLLATWGKSSGEYPLDRIYQPTLFAEFYRVDGEFCPSMAANADLAKQQRSIVGDTDQGRTDNEQAAVPLLSLAIRLAYLAEWSLDERNVAFRNISSQIARLDWTHLFKGQLADWGVRNTASASNPIER